MAITSNFPAIRPSLNLDFANAKALDPRITFSRASAATYYDGKTVAKAEENLLTRSQEFDSTAWGKVSCNITPNSAAAPDGTTTATTLTAVAGDVSPCITNAANQISTVQHVVSFYAKAGTHQFIQYTNNYGTGTFANFDLSTGQVGSNGAAVTYSQIISVGNGWYRCIVVLSTLQYTHIRLVPSASSGYGALMTATGTESVYIWGAQLEQRSQVTAYTPTTSSPITNYIPVLQTAPAGVPRFDHNPVTGESLGLLVEEQRTNLLLNSNSFIWNESTTSGPSTTNRYRTENAAVAPDGTQTAIKISSATTSVLQRIYTVSTGVTVGSPVTYSIYAKAGEYTRVGLKFTTDAATDFIVDLTNGTILQVGSATSQFITPVGNGWYRLGIVVTPTVSPVVWVNLIAPAGLSSVFTGDGYSGIYLWGAQLEAGAFPTSYIKTEASQVTRAADSASMTGTNFSSWYRQDEGTVAQEFSPLGVSVADRASVVVYESSGGFYTNSITVRNYNGSHKASAHVNTVSQAEIGVTPNIVRELVYKIAYSYQSNYLAFARDGGSPAIDTFASIPIVNALLFPGSGCQHIKRFAYYPRRLTDAQLQALTV